MDTPYIATQAYTRHTYVYNAQVLIYSKCHTLPSVSCSSSFSKAVSSGSLIVAERNPRRQAVFSRVSLWGEPRKPCRRRSQSKVSKLVKLDPALQHINRRHTHKYTHMQWMSEANKA